MYSYAAQGKRILFDRNEMRLRSKKKTKTWLKKDGEKERSKGLQKATGWLKVKEKIFLKK